MKNFYIAARYPRKEEMEGVSLRLEKELGWSSKSSWVKGSEEGLTRKEIAMIDLVDVKESDIMILFTNPKGEPHPGGGRFVEFGYALALGLKCYVIGNYENVFCHHPLVKVYPNVDDFILDWIVR